MSHGKYESKRKRRLPILWVLVIVSALSLLFGGTWAYLSLSDGPVTNSFAVEAHPTLTVNADNSITVTMAEESYAVYVRAAVVVNWQDSSGNILAVKPSEFSYDVDENWLKHSDGFYYYKQTVTSGVSTSSVIANVRATPGHADEGFTLVADIAAQAIQAVGQTDDPNPIDAVADAWGIAADDFVTPEST